MSIIKNLAQWIFGVFLVLLAIGLLFDGVLIGSIFTAIGGLVCIPRTRKWLENKFGIPISRRFKYGLTLMGFLSFFLSVPNASVQAPKQQSIAAIDSTKVAETPKIPSPPVAPVSEAQVVKPDVKVVEEKLPLKLDNQPTPSKLADELSKSNLNPVPQPKVRKDKSNGSGSSSSRSSGHGGYILGPRGGCYYINGNGNKTYVDHSLCR